MHRVLGFEEPGSTPASGTPKRGEPVSCFLGFLTTDTWGDGGESSLLPAASPGGATPHRASPSDEAASPLVSRDTESPSALTHDTNLSCDECPTPLALRDAALALAARSRAAPVASLLSRSQNSHFLSTHSKHSAPSTHCHRDEPMSSHGRAVWDGQDVAMEVNLMPWSGRACESNLKTLT